MNKVLNSRWLKITIYCILGVFLASYAINSCNPALMKQFVSMNSFSAAILSVVRWISYLSVLTYTISIIYNKKTFNNISVFIVLPACVLSLIFTNQYFSISEMSVLLKVFHFIFYSLSIILGVYIALKREFKNNILKTFGEFALTFILFIPLNILEQFGVLMNTDFFKFYTFGIWHFVFIALAILLVIVFHFILKNKTKEQKFDIMFFFSIVMVYQLLNRFSVVSIGAYHSLTNIFAALPLYVCSFCILLLPFAVASKNKLFQSILFLVNMAGAFSVFVYMDPGAGSSIFSYNITYFSFNHLMLFAFACNLPKLEAEVKFKNFLKLAYMLAIFLVAVSILNNICIINGFNPNYSYISFPPIPLFGIEKILVLTIGKMSFPILYMLVLYIFYMLLFMAGFGIYILVRKINTSIQNKRRSVVKA